MQAQYFHYKIIETKPLTDLEQFKDHKRLRVFYEKGCKCVKCGIEGTQLALGESRGQLHWDVYTNDFYPLTVDHTIPKSKGGSDHIDNLEPMCCLCNWKKGNGVEPHCNYQKPKYSKEQTKEKELEVGIEVGICIKKKVKRIGIIASIEPNPKHPNRVMSVTLEGKPGSYYALKSVSKIKIN